MLGGVFGRCSDIFFFFVVYFRVLVNFIRFIDYSIRLENVSFEEFREVFEVVVDTVR